MVAAPRADIPGEESVEESNEVCAGPRKKIKLAEVSRQWLNLTKEVTVPMVQVNQDEILR